MRNITEENLTDIVLDRINADNPRMQKVATSLVKHLHAFIRDIEPTEEEWFTAIKFLTDTGQKCDDVRQEYILLSDTLGVSMLVDAINHRRGGNGTTESTVLGPFHSSSDVKENGANVANGPEAGRGDPCVVRGKVLDVDGNPIVGAKLDMWQASDDGFYDVQPESNQPEKNLRGIFHTDENGEFWFRSVVPLYYPVPTDGPVGDLLKATGRHPMRPAHIHYWVTADGYEQLITHVFKAGDEYLDSDAVFGVKESLIAEFVLNESMEKAASYGFDRPFYEVDYTLVLMKT